MDQKTNEHNYDDFQIISENNSVIYYNNDIKIDII